MFENEKFVEGLLLRIFIREDDHWENGSLCDAIVVRLRKEGVAGASVFRGVEGFGSHREIHLNRIFTFHTKMPLLIEVVDTTEKITALVPIVESMVEDGMVTVERVEYRRFMKAGAR